MPDDPLSVIKQEQNVSVETNPLEVQYARCIRILTNTEIIKTLPIAKCLGVIGIDGEEYPVPTLEQVKNLFDKNRELVTKKKSQGFTRLQLTPFAVSIANLKKHAGSVILQHYQEKKIFQAKKNPLDPDIPIEVDKNEPIWTWTGLNEVDENGTLIYFSRSYDLENDHSYSKPELIDVIDVCPISGWSVMLIESFAILPQEGEGQIIGERKQLEINSAPMDYLETLRGAGYEGETGWTPEDLLIDFISRLEETNQVSHDWNDYSALWLLATYQKDEAGVPYADWYRGYKQLSSGTYSADVKIQGWGSRSAVRLF
jgi:hypothetical protein